MSNTDEQHTTDEEGTTDEQGTKKEQGTTEEKGTTIKELTLEELEEKHNKIIEVCRQSKTLFEDPDFPADYNSIKLPAPNGTEYEWMRPKEIDSDATFIENGFTRSDVKQGYLGNCWVLAAMSGMAERHDLITRVVPEDQSMNDNSYCGAFRFRMRRFGKETEILVDDRLPTKNNQPVYSQQLNGEFWVCLLEKALAKNFGCYKSLEGGLIYEALADLTGGLCEEIKISDGSSDLSELARHIDKCINIKHSVVGASSLQKGNNKTNEMGNGLVYSHAYTVTGLKSIQVEDGSAMGKSVDLIRLLNPWGATEWSGSWSDNCSGWSDEQKNAVKLEVRDEGEFWMSFEDFAKFFRAVTIVHFAITADVPETKTQAGNHEWRSFEHYGEWKSGQTSGGQPANIETHFANQQYPVEFHDSDEDGLASCLVSVEEPDQRGLQQPKGYVSKAVFLYKLADGESREFVAKTAFVRCRTLVHRFRVPPGRYAVMPCTFEPSEEGRFLLKIFTEA